jgi:hypothetical protein
MKNTIKKSAKAIPKKKTAAKKTTGGTETASDDILQGWARIAQFLGRNARATKGQEHDCFSG